MKDSIEYRNESNDLIYRINKRNKTGEYYIIEDARRSLVVNNPVRLLGFSILPSGFYRNGFGLTYGGNYATQEIYNRYNKTINLTIVAQGRSRLDARGKFVDLTISHQDLNKLNKVIRGIKRESSETMRVEAQRFLGKSFSQFSQLKDAEASYIPGQLEEVLEQKDLLNGLNEEDRNALEEFIPAYLSSIPGTLKAKKKLKVIFDTLDAGKRIFLRKVIQEFKKRLDSNSQNEAIWQNFLSEYILILRNNYGEVLEKESVSLQGKFPDFMLIDPYGYIDIYEIKKPSTQLLRLDNSRNNYFWDAELSKAIAQVENYSYQAQRHADILATDIRKAKNIDVSIVRPRGYIIAGRRSQLISEKMRDDFRILCESLKNVDIILYDDLLDNLELFVERTEIDNKLSPI